MPSIDVVPNTTRSKYHTPGADKNICIHCSRTITGCGLKCNNDHFLHIKCTGLDIIQVKGYYTSTRQFNCNNCISDKADNEQWDWLEKLWREEVDEEEAAAETPRISQEEHIVATNEDHSVPSEVSKCESEANEIYTTSLSEQTMERETNDASFVTPNAHKNTPSTITTSSTPHRNPRSDKVSDKKSQFGLLKNKYTSSQNEPREGVNRSNKVCKYMLNKGECNRGNNCRYEHPRPCRYFKYEGKCPQEDACEFLHPRLCKFGKECRRSTMNNCKFMHTKIKPTTREQCPITTKTGKCNAYLCTYTHYPLCKHWMAAGMCEYKDSNGPGAVCKYRHPTLCRNSLTHKKCTSPDCELYHMKGTVRSDETKTPTKAQASNSTTGTQNRTSTNTTDNHFPVTENNTWKRRDMEQVLQRLDVLQQQITQLKSNQMFNTEVETDVNPMRKTNTTPTCVPTLTHSTTVGTQPQTPPQAYHQQPIYPQQPLQRSQVDPYQYVTNPHQQAQYPYQMHHQVQPPQQTQHPYQMYHQTQPQRQFPYQVNHQMAPAATTQSAVPKPQLPQM